MCVCVYVCVCLRVMGGGDVVVGHGLGHILIDLTMRLVEQVVLWAQQKVREPWEWWSGVRWRVRSVTELKGVVVSAYLLLPLLSLYPLPPIYAPPFSHSPSILMSPSTLPWSVASY